jgi:CRP/FNR family transcriptional regulator, cyclic AMP receptor protein
MKAGKLSDKAQSATDGAPECAQALCQLVARQPFFKGLKQAHIQALANLAMEKEFKAGEHIFSEGDPANRFYIILSGRVELHYPADSQCGVRTQSLGAGDDLGWSWLFPPYYFLATAQAVEPVHTIFFYGTRLRQRCDEDHDLGYEVMKRIAQVAIHHLTTARRGEAVKTKDQSVRAGRK